MAPGAKRRVLDVQMNAVPHDVEEHGCRGNEKGKIELKHISILRLLVRFLNRENHCYPYLLTSSSRLFRRSPSPAQAGRLPTLLHAFTSFCAGSVSTGSSSEIGRA